MYGPVRRKGLASCVLLLGVIPSVAVVVISRAHYTMDVSHSFHPSDQDRGGQILVSLLVTISLTLLNTPAWKLLFNYGNNPRKSAHDVARIRFHHHLNIAHIRVG